MGNNTVNFIDTSADEVNISGHPLSWWEQEYGLPLNILHAPLIKKNVLGFKEIFQKYYPQGEIRFAGKAHPHPAIFKIMKDEGIGIDVASYNETQCALDAGISPSLLDLNGNAKEDFSIRDAIAKDILIVADSIEELQLISKLSLELNKQPRVILRITGFDMESVTDETVFTAGKWSKFGTDITLIPEILNNLKSFPGLKFLGFHTHIGSQITDVEPYLIVLGKMIELGHFLNNAGGECKIINIGGGFPVSYLNKTSWDSLLEKIKYGYACARNGVMTQIHVWNNGTGCFAKDKNGNIDASSWEGEKFYSQYPKFKMLEAILTSHIAVNGKSINSVEALNKLGKPALMIEAGRSIVADAGITLARVAHVRKIVDNHNLITLEMGVANISEALMIPIVRRWETLTNYHVKDEQPFETFIAGNLCFSGDMISRYKIPLQRKPKRGDIITAYDTGAYDSHFLASNTNLFPRPARLLTTNTGQVTVLKERDTYKRTFS